MISAYGRTALSVVICRGETTTICDFQQGRFLSISLELFEAYLIGGIILYSLPVAWCRRALVTPRPEGSSPSTCLACVDRVRGESIIMNDKCVLASAGRGKKTPAKVRVFSVSRT